jgi:hypothetical protein
MFPPFRLWASVSSSVVIQAYSVHFTNVYQTDHGFVIIIASVGDRITINIARGLTS